MLIGRVDTVPHHSVSAVRRCPHSRSRWRSLIRACLLFPHYPESPSPPPKSSSAPIEIPSSRSPRSSRKGDGYAFPTPMPFLVNFLPLLFLLFWQPLSHSLSKTLHSQPLCLIISKKDRKSKNSARGSFPFITLKPTHSRLFLLSIFSSQFKFSLTEIPSLSKVPEATKVPSRVSESCCRLCL